MGSSCRADSDTCHCCRRSLLQPLNDTLQRFWGSSCDPELLLASIPRKDWSPCHIQGKDIVVPPPTGEQLVPNFTRDRNITLFFSGESAREDPVHLLPGCSMPRTSTQVQLLQLLQHIMRALLSW